MLYYNKNTKPGPKNNSEVSLFSRVVAYLNSKWESGDTEFTTKDYINKVGSYEASTWWKSRNNNRYYRTYTYRTYLKRLGYLQNKSRGKWKVIHKIPEYVNSGFVNFVLGYSGTYDRSSFTFVTQPYVIKLPLVIKNASSNSANCNEYSITIDRNDLRDEWKRRMEVTEFKSKHGIKDLGNPLTSAVVYLINKRMLEELRKELELINYK